MSWIDTHCHLDDFEDPSSAIDSARVAGVTAMVTVGTDLETSRLSVELALTHEPVWAVVGIHPHAASSFNPGLLQEIVGLASEEKVVGIGETGLDYYRELSPRSSQKAAFSEQIEAAKTLDLALVIHLRDAHDELFGLLEEAGPPQRLVFHCFSGGGDYARRALDLGGHISFAGNISYRGAEDLRDAALATPLDRLLVETDSPYLAPLPHRGKRNEPAFLPAVGAALAEALRKTQEEVAEATFSNARRVFRIP
jgi:TatD DNase family protein